jgi:hypothetical protein
MKTPHKAASCPPPDVTDCTWESAYYTTDPNYNPLRGGLVGGPDDDDVWADDRDMNNPANTVSLLNSAGFSAAMAALVDNDINMAKCQQGEYTLAGKEPYLFVELGFAWIFCLLKITTAHANTLQGMTLVL